MTLTVEPGQWGKLTISASPDNHNIHDSDDNDDNDDIYIMMQCLSGKIFTCHFRAERWRRKVSGPLGDNDDYDDNDRYDRDHHQHHRGTRSVG